LTDKGVFTRKELRAFVNVRHLSFTNQRTGFVFVTYKSVFRKR